VNGASANGASANGGTVTHAGQADGWALAVAADRQWQAWYATLPDAMRGRYDSRVAALDSRAVALGLRGSGTRSSSWTAEARIRALRTDMTVLARDIQAALGWETIADAHLDEALARLWHRVDTVRRELATALSTPGSDAGV